MSKIHALSPDLSACRRRGRTFRFIDCACKQSSSTRKRRTNYCKLLCLTPSSNAPSHVFHAHVCIQLNCLSSRNSFNKFAVEKSLRRVKSEMVWICLLCVLYGKAVFTLRLHISNISSSSRVKKRCEAKTKIWKEFSLIILTQLIKNCVRNHERASEISRSETSKSAFSNAISWMILPLLRRLLLPRTSKWEREDDKPNTAPTAYNLSALQGLTISRI